MLVDFEDEMEEAERTGETGEQFDNVDFIFSYFSDPKVDR
jgi:hypothetical protein